MIVTLSWIGEQGISRDIAVRPCHIGAIPAIGHSAAAEDIVESNDRLILVGEGLTVETVLRRFCDYYVIGQFRLEAESIGKDAGTDEVGVVVDNRVIDEYRSLRESGFPGKTCADIGLIAGDEILDDLSFKPIRQVDAAPRTARNMIPLDDIPFDDQGSSPGHVDATSCTYQLESTHPVVGDHIVEDLRERSSMDTDPATPS